VHDQREVPFFAVGALLKYMQLGEAFSQWYSEVWSSGEFRLLQLRPGLAPSDLEIQAWEFQSRRATHAAGASEAQ
jgi:hypothetical protein